MVRHGEAHGNAERVYLGHTDSLLTELGQEQARKRGEELKDVKFDAIYSSDLMRAKHTAELIKMERDLVIKTTELLRERFFGVFENKTREDLTKDQLEYQKFFNHYDTLSEKERFQSLPHDSWEEHDDLISRGLTALREISLANPGKTVLVTSHGGIMRGILGHLDEKYYSLRIRNTGWVKFSCDGAEIKILETKDIIPADEHLKSFKK